jgi:hypothetical protein
MTAAKKPPPWERKAPPKKGPPAKLTEAEKRRARARAEAAGRRYPNLVDNLAILKERTAKGRSKK